MLPRPSCIPVLKTLNITKNQQNKDNTSGDEITSDTEHTATMPPTRTCPIPSPRPSKATNVKDTSAYEWKHPTQAHADPTPVRKSPLLPTPPAQNRQTFIPRPSSYYSNHYHSQQCITGPSTVMNSQFHYQPHLTRPFPAITCNQRPSLLPNLRPGHQITSAYKTIPTHSRTLHTASIHIFTCFTAISKCYQSTILGRQMNTQSKKK